jgi:hypothetical protein
MNKELLIELFADAKFQTSKYDGDLSGRTYWEGVQAAYQNMLNLMYPGWGSNLVRSELTSERGIAVWMCSNNDYEVLRNAADNVQTWKRALENDIPAGTELQPLK